MKYNDKRGKIIGTIRPQEQAQQQDAENGKGEPVPPQKVQNVIQIPLSGILTITVTIIGLCVAATWMLSSSIGDAKEDIATLKTKVETLHKDFSEMKLQSSEMYEYLYYDGGVKDQLGDISEALNIEVVNVPDDSSYAPIKSTVKQVRMPESAAPSSIIPTSTIGLYRDGKPCYAKDVINEPILLTYTEGTKEVYFYGTFNEKYQWDGYCVTNVYSQDGLLTGICESNFENGNRLDYKSLYQDAGEWIYSDKDCADEGNIGINIRYSLPTIRLKILPVPM